MKLLVKGIRDRCDNSIGTSRLKERIVIVKAGGCRKLQAMMPIIHLFSTTIVIATRNVLGGHCISLQPRVIEALLLTNASKMHSSW